MKRYRFTGQDLATRLGVSRNTISNYRHTPYDLPKHILLALDAIEMSLYVDHRERS